MMVNWPGYNDKFIAFIETQAPGQIAFFPLALNPRGPTYANHFLGNPYMPVSGSAAITTPAIATGAGAGTGGALTVSISGTDLSGKINLTTGLSPSVGADSTVVTVTFFTAWPAAPLPVFSPVNSAAAGVMSLLHVTATTTTFTITVSTVGLGASTSYIWNYHCIG